MSRPFDVVVVGDLNADLILSGNAVPEFGQVEKLIDDATLTFGSSSGIFACGAAQLGLRVAFIGLVGDDLFGQFVLDHLRARGVDTRGVVVDRSIKTGLTVILSQERGGDRALLTHLGSIAALRFAHIDQALLAQARHLHVGGYFLLDGLRPDVPRLFDVAHTHDLTVSIDTNYDPTERWQGIEEVLRRADIALPNETELRAITGLDDIEAALLALSRNVPTVAAKLGARGATARRAGETASAVPPHVSVVDTTGAGDSFDAGFVYGSLSGWSLERTLRLACACGALSTRAAGGTPAQPTLEEALESL